MSEQDRKREMWLFANQLCDTMVRNRYGQMEAADMKCDAILQAMVKCLPDAGHATTASLQCEVEVLRATAEANAESRTKCPTFTPDEAACHQLAAHVREQEEALLDEAALSLQGWAVCDGPTVTVCGIDPNELLRSTLDGLHTAWHMRFDQAQHRVSFERVDRFDTD